MDKHSPGPWVWQGIGRDGAPTLYACGGEKRYLVKGASGATTPRLSDVDARLIAAGPELLEALKEQHEALGCEVYEGCRFCRLIERVEGAAVTTGADPSSGSEGV